ncbi:MAG: right-handed parallel beta-helix repeat-containing protein [Sedimentisphaerales bacterium]|nr:right-handed parallel beta-helix repeat-containing protein [Sedimentisphaerales bacterium]
MLSLFSSRKSGSIVTLFLSVVLLYSAGAAAKTGPHKTDWFKNAHYGVFMHFLPADAQGLAQVNHFDVDALAAQLESVGAGYFVLTLGQNSGFMNSPNSVYDRITEYKPGRRCSTRDLPLDLYRALYPKGIKLMLYLPCQVPNRDTVAQKAFGLPQGPQDQPIDVLFAKKWAQVIHEWSSRYGDKVAGWWFDGGYEWIGFNEEIARIYADAVKRGNPQAIVTFNPGVKLIRWTQAEDYTAGELNEPFGTLPANRWVEGSQWHALTYVGSRWSAHDTRYPAQRWAQWVSKVIGKDGVVTLDVGPNWNPDDGPIGAISTEQMAQLQQVKVAVAKAANAIQSDLYISTDGNDSWSGKLPAANTDRSDGPLATIEAAQKLVRKIQKEQMDRQRPIVVTIRGGTYWLTKPLNFMSENSGTANAPIIYQAYEEERPVFSGGVEIKGWQVDSKGWWHVDLPDVTSWKWRFTQLFVNDQRRFRPQLPEKGYYKIARKVDPSPQSAGKGHDRFGFNEGEINKDWANLQYVEVVAFHSWAASRLRIAKVDTAERTVTLQGHTTGMSSWAELKKGNRYRLENVKEALGKPGQWYVDCLTGRLTYIPREGETLENTTIVVPRVQNLLLLNGELVFENRLVQNIQFKGLTFAHANWRGEKGQSFPQAEINLGAAVAAMGARNIVFENCAIRHVGEYAMGFGPGCQYNRISGCELVDLGAGGIKIGSALPAEWGNTLAAPDDEEALVSHHTVEDCLIAHAGRLHPAAIGVWVGHSPYNVIRYNDVYDLYYSAFSLGWVWGYGPSKAHHNEVAFNHAHHIGQRVLSDMGCIYTLGISPGTTIHDNHFHDVVSYDYGGWGLYTDEGSTGVEMKNNLVYRCSRGGFHQHYGKENRIENNIFAYGGEHQIQRTRTEEHISFFFEHNIVFWDNDSPLFGSNWKDNNYRLDYNLYWHMGKPITFPDGLRLEQWQQQRNQDLHSLIADPGFVDPVQDDYHLKADSPALEVGFQPFDYTQAGRRKPVVLTRDLPDVPAGFEGS